MRKKTKDLQAITTSGQAIKTEIEELSSSLEFKHKAIEEMAVQSSNLQGEIAQQQNLLKKKLKRLLKLLNQQSRTLQQLMNINLSIYKLKHYWLKLSNLMNMLTRQLLASMKK